MRMLMNRSNMTNAVCAAILAAALVPAAGGAERVAAPRGGRDVQYIVIELELPAPWTDATPYAMNDQGQIVGQGEYSGEDRAFLWDDGEMILLDVLPGHSWSVAYDINNAGVIVGWSDGDYHHPVAWVDGEIIDLGDGTEGWAFAINDEGTIVGWSEVDGDWHAFIGDVTGWQIDLGANWPGEDSCATGINEEGIVVGWVDVGEVLCIPRDTFMWDDGAITLLWQLPPNQPNHYIPWDINEARCVVGEKRHGWYMDCAAYEYQAWHWQAGEGVLLPTPNPVCYFHAAFAINDAGDAVGRAHDIYDEHDCGALWRDGVAYDLNDLIDPEGGCHIGRARDIDNQGRIAAATDYPPRPLLLLPIKPGDVDEDGDVDTADLLAMLAAWGPCEGCPEDIDGNGVVNTADLLILLANWG